MMLEKKRNTKCMSIFILFKKHIITHESKIHPQWKVVMSALTIFLAEDKEEVSSAVFDICIQMSHKTDQPTLHSGPFLWPVCRVSQRRQDLMISFNFSFTHEKQKLQS